MKYSLHKEEKDHFVIGHPDGSTFKVAKHGLSKESLGRIRGLEPLQLADGGEVPEAESEEEAPEEPSKDTSTQEQYGPINPNSDWEGSAGIEPKTPVPDTAAAPSAATAAPSAATVPLPAGNVLGQLPEPYKQAYGPEIEAIKKLGQIEAAGQQREAGIWDKYASSYAPPSPANVQQMAKDHQEFTQKIMGQNQAITNAVINGKIDPHRYWDNMSTGNRVMTGIGLILGGAASHWTGGRNLALDQLNREIDRDIESQVKNSENKKSAFAMNNSMLKDSAAALAATRADLYAATVGLLKKNAAQTGSPEAIQRANLAAQQIITDKIMPLIPTLRAIDLKNEAAGIGPQAQGGGIEGVRQAPGLTPEKAMSLGTLDPKAAQTLVPVNGKYMMANDTNSAEGLRQSEALMGQITDNLKKLSQVDALAAKVPGSQANKDVGILKKTIAVQMAHLFAARSLSKRPPSDALIEQFEGQIGDPRFEVGVYPPHINTGVNWGHKNETLLKTMHDDQELFRSKHINGYVPRLTK